MSRVQIVPFQPEHLAGMTLQPTQATAQARMTLEHGQQLLDSPGLARTALKDGQPIVCAGVIEMWPGRACAWSYIAAGADRFFKDIHRAVLRVLAGSRWRRVEMTVDVRDPYAKRWAAHLGFKFEGVLRAWTHDGRDIEMWARVNR